MSWRPYNEFARWNQRITPEQRRKVDVNSDRIAAQFAQDQYDAVYRRLRVSFSANDHWSHPIYHAKASDPTYRVELTADWGTTIQGHTVLIPPGAAPERGNGVYEESDYHLAVVQPNGWEYDFYKTTQIGSGKIVARFGGRTLWDGNGTHAYATGLADGLAGGNITAEELKAGEIRHALFTVARATNGMVVNGSWSKMAADEGNPSRPASGQLLTLTMTHDEIWAAYPDPITRACLLAIRRYGMYVGDTGGGFWKAESELPWTQYGQRSPLYDLSASGQFVVPVPWDRVRALVP